MALFRKLFARAAAVPVIEPGYFPQPLAIVRAQTWAPHPIARASVAAIDYDHLHQLAAAGPLSDVRPGMQGVGLYGRFAGDLGPLQNFARGPFVGFDYRSVRPGFLRGLPATWSNPAGASTTVAAISRGLAT